MCRQLSQECEAKGHSEAIKITGQMTRMFPSIRLVLLLVGIGGGASREDIRLGDVVLANRTDTRTMPSTTMQHSWPRSAPKSC